MSDRGGRLPPAVTLAALAGLTLVGLALRLPSFNDSLWGDELSTNFVVNGFGAGSVIHIVSGEQEGTPPLFFLLTWLTKGLGDVEGLRLVSLLAGLCAIPLTYLVGERTVGRCGGLVGAALVALSPFLIFFSTEARAYALMMFLCLLATLALLVAAETGRARWWVLYGLSVAAAAYTHYTSVFFLVSLLGWALIARPKARRPLLLANLGAALLYVPWVPGLLDDRGGPASRVLEVVDPLTFDHAKTDLIRWSIGHPYAATGDVPGDLAVWMIVAGAVVGVIGLAIALRRRADWWPPPASALLPLVLVLGPPLGMVVYNVFEPTVFIPRNLIASWPALALLLGGIAAAGRKPLSYVAMGLLVAGFGIGGAKLLDASNQRPDFAGVVGFVERTGQPGAPVVDVQPFTPGPQTPLEAAFAPKGQAAPTGRQVMTLAYPTLSKRLELVRAGGGYFAPVPTPTGAQIARKAARIAGSGKLFVTEPAISLQLAGGELDKFLASLPPGFHVVDSRVFPGLAPFSIRVYALQRASGAPLGELLR
jgi:mannosyltransferase